MKPKQMLITLLTTALACFSLSAPTAFSNDASKLAHSSITRVITLGTAAGPIPRVKRSQPANVIIVRDKPYLVDAGNGVLRQLAAAHVPFTAIDNIFVTHHHDDHNADVGTVLGMSWDRGRKTPINVYGPPGTIDLIQGFLQYFRRNAEIRSSDIPKPDPKSIFIGHDIDAVGPVYQDENIKVTAAENTHFAGIKPGTPAYGRDKSFAFRFETPDRVVVFTGDTGPSDAVTKLAKGADILISEVLDPVGAERLLTKFYSSQTDEFRKRLLRHLMEDHLTPEQVGEMAAAAGVKMVVLTHLVPGADDETDDHPYSDGVEKFFHGPVVVAKDLMSF